MKLSQGQVMTTSKGYIFDIKRFATHDGKGIRTTVFLRGAHFAVSGVKIQKDCLIYHKSCIWNPSVCIVLVVYMHQNRVELDM